MKNNKLTMIGIVLLVLNLLINSGCAFGKFGNAEGNYSDITLPSGLNGQSKIEIINKLGVPDSTINANGSEYWKYYNKYGFFFCLFGKTKTKDMVLEFKNEKVSNAYLMETGSSIGILATQGSVAQ